MVYRLTVNTPVLGDGLPIVAGRLRWHVQRGGELTNGQRNHCRLTNLEGNQMALTREEEEWVAAAMKSEEADAQNKADYEAAVAELAAVEARLQSEVDAETLKANAAINAVATSYAAELAAKREAVETAKGKIKVEVAKKP